MVVVITGASRGIGRAAARHFAERGASVVLAARSEGAPLGVATECEALGGRALAVPTDVAEWGSVEELARRAVEHFGRIDVWVNNAVLAAVGRLEEVPPEANRRVVEVNTISRISASASCIFIFLLCLRPACLPAPSASYAIEPSTWKRRFSVVCNRLYE